MATNDISVKVYYLENGTNKEIRKYTLDEDVANNYEYLMGRVKIFFTGLVEKDLLLYWKDGEGDYISISSDGELFEVINNDHHNEVGCLKLYITVKTSNSVPINNCHPGVVCDGCDGTISGIRYKCTVCPDFDLCSTCENKQNHPFNHHMLCIKTPNYRIGGLRGCHPWLCMGNSPFRFVPQSFRQSKKTACPKEKESNSDTGNETSCKEFIEQIASAFGLHPDVAVSQTQSFLDHLYSQPEPQCDVENGTDVPPQASDNMEQMFGINPECLKDMFKPLFQHCCEKELPKETKSSQCGYREGSNVDVNVNDAVNMESMPVVDEKEVIPDNMECLPVIDEKEANLVNLGSIPVVDREEATSSTTCSNSKDEFMDVATPFLNQMGIGSALPEEEMKNLSKIIGTVMKNIGSHFDSLPTCDDSKEFTSHTENTRPDEFIFVDGKSKDNEMTEEEVYERRLVESLDQMEAMGFDNDGDWLKQLLVAKDLDISKVLDALNPPKI